MITSTTNLPGLALQALQNRGVQGFGNRSGGAFDTLLGAAMDRQSAVPDGQPLPANTVSVLAQAMMAALAQAQGGGWPGGMPFLPTAPYRAQPLPGAWSSPAAPPQPAAGSDSATPGATPYDAIIHRAAQRYGVEEGLIRAVIQAESSFDPKAVSPVGAQGLMQLMPATAAELGVSHPFDPEENIMGGTRYLSRLLGRYQGDNRLALAAYNWGMGNLERQPENMPTETKRYVAKIMGMVDGSSGLVHQSNPAATAANSRLAALRNAPNSPA